MVRLYQISLLVLLGGIIYLYLMVPPSPDPIYIKGTTTIDTFYLEQDTIRLDPIILKVPVRDTIYVDSNQDSIQSGIASLDTILLSGDTLNVDYYIEPSIFDVRLRYHLDSTMVLEETRIDTILTTEFKSKKYDNFLVGFVSGNLSMLVLVKVLIGVL